MYKKINFKASTKPGGMSNGNKYFSKFYMSSTYCVSVSKVIEMKFVFKKISAVQISFKIIFGFITTSSYLFYYLIVG